MIDKILCTALRLQRHVARRRLRRYLLTLSDSLLLDQGFSRAKLERGLVAWPWRLEPELVHRSSPVPQALPGVPAEPVVAQSAGATEHERPVVPA